MRVKKSINTVYCSYSSKYEYMCLFSDTFCIYHSNLPQKGGNYGEQAENFLVYSSFL